MSKFCDLPYYLLNNYFNDIIANSALRTSTSYLRGPSSAIPTTIITSGGYNTILYVKHASGYFDGDYIAHNFRIKSVSDNDFIFEYVGVESGYQIEVAGDDEIKTPGTFMNGNEVYFRKDDYVHEWLDYLGTYEDYYNRNKVFLYFGKIYSTSNTDEYKIEFHGMKDFAIESLPTNNRTAKIQEFLDIYLDQTHSKIYSKMKNLWAMKDAKEVDLDYLSYLAHENKDEFDDSRSLITDGHITELAFREFVENYIYFLKRKGTYASFFIIWKALFNSNNSLNIYERWNSYNIDDNPEDDFVDYNYLQYYSVTASGGAGDPYYREYYPNTTRKILVDDSIGYWKLDESSGLIANDESTWLNHGTFENATDSDWSTDGLFGNCWYSVDAGSGARLNCGNDSPLNNIGYVDVGDEDEGHTDNYSVVGSGSFSLSFWMKNDSSGDNAIIFNKYENAQNYIQVSKYIGVSNKMDVLLSSNSDGTTKAARATFTCTVDPWDGDWHHVIYTLNNITKRHNLYVDGSLEEYITFDDAKTTTDHPNNLKNIGNVGWLAHITGTYPFLGYLDELSIFDKALTQAEVSELYSGHDILSPHYRVEIDLNTEPMGDTYIINSEIWDALLRFWTITNPVNRFPHYNMLISPITDMSESLTSIDTAGYKASSVIMDSKFTGIDASITVGEYAQTTHGSTWKYYHDLGTDEFLIDFYDSNKKKIIPESIKKDINFVEAEFGKSVAGSMYISDLATSGSSYDQTTSASTWTNVHYLGDLDTLTQYYSNLTNKMISPSGSKLYDPNTVEATFSENVGGEAFTKRAEYIHTQAVASSSWTVEHNLNAKGLIVKCYDDSFLEIIPDEITMTTYNTCIITFGDQTVSGYAMFIEFAKTWTQTSIIDSITTWAIGTGTTDTYNVVAQNSLETQVRSNTTFISEDIIGIGGSGKLWWDDASYYYYDFDVGILDDINITEIALLNVDGDVVFYTKCSQIHKPDGVNLRVHYRVEKNT